MRRLSLFLLPALLIGQLPGIPRALPETPESNAPPQPGICEDPLVSVGPALNDLGPAEYIRMGRTPTGYYGGLYPAGSNVRPPAHEAAGIAVAGQIQPLDGAGNPDLQNGRIGMISVGMSNTSAEFISFIDLVTREPAVNDRLVVVNGSQSGETSIDWLDPDGWPWDVVDERLVYAGLTPAQVQVAWVKQTREGIHDFPVWSQIIQGDLETIARNLLIRYPNIKIAYYSSRTRSYKIWEGLSPEPAAFENGFSVKWMIEKQIDGDPNLNFDPGTGDPVVAPYLSWGPYIWADGINPRSDGFTWLPQDMRFDCTHPSAAGSLKIGCELIRFFAADTTSSVWFRDEPGPVHCYHLYLPNVNQPTSQAILAADLTTAKPATPLGVRFAESGTLVLAVLGGVGFGWLLKPRWN